MGYTKPETRKRLNQTYYERNKERLKEQARQYYHSHKGQVLERLSVYRAENAELIKAQQHRSYKKRYARDKDRILAQNKVWINNNPEKRSALFKRYRNRHLEEQRQRERTYAANHPEIIREKSRRKRARRAQVESTLTVTQWEAIKTAYNSRCAYCGEHPEILTQDHVIPFSTAGRILWIMLSQHVVLAIHLKAPSPRQLK